MSEDFDVVIVGGGITGSAMGIVLARSGVRVKVLERDRIYQDRVRGEFMASWGVKELQRLGLADILTEAGGIFVDHFIPYDENIPAEMAEKFAFEFPTLGPDIPATLCMGHPAMCEALNQAAMAAGAEVVRGVKSIKIQSGGKPSVSYKLDDEEYTLQPKLLIGLMAAIPWFNDNLISRCRMTRPTIFWEACWLRAKPAGPKTPLPPGPKATSIF